MPHAIGFAPTSYVGRATGYVEAGPQFGAIPASGWIGVVLVYRATDTDNTHFCGD